jgi:CheY-like chemotaxis protein
MSEEQLERIFASFEQADSSTTRRYGGSGLGLAICRRLAELMEGRVWAESHEGVGSTFYVELPFTVQAAATLQQSKQGNSVQDQQTRPLAILLAEDNRINAEFIVKILGRMGHLVTAVEDGQQALEQLKRQQFDCILMDIQMPVLGGDAATKIIREQEKQTGAHIPIIALTAHAMNEERERLLTQGFDAHVAKPVDVAQLLAELALLKGNQ